eukprot:jgi/Bigna1/76749/fgenesh1_pg.43_\
MYTNTDDDIVIKACLQALLKLVHPKTDETRLDVVVTAIRVFQRYQHDAYEIFIELPNHFYMQQASKTRYEEHGYGDNAAVMVPALDCLAIFAKDIGISNIITRMGLVDTISEAISTLANSRIMVEMSELVETYSDTLPLLHKYLHTCERICTIPQLAEKVASTVIPRIVKIVLEFPDEIPVLRQGNVLSPYPYGQSILNILFICVSTNCFSALTALTSSSKASVAIAKKTCELARNAIKEHYKDASFLLKIMTFLSNLFLQMHAAEIGLLKTPILITIVNRLGDAIDEVVTHTVLEVLYNAAISTNKVKTLMKDQNTITELRVVKAILTPKLDLGDVDKMLETEIDLGIGPSARARFGDLDRKQTEAYKLPSRYRNFLWHRDSKRIEDAHLQIRRDLKRLLWSNPSNPQVKKSMGVWKMRRVKSGASAPAVSGKKKGGFKSRVALDARTFSIYGCLHRIQMFSVMFAFDKGIFYSIMCMHKRAKTRDVPQVNDKSITR